MGKFLGSYDGEEIDRPDLNKCPDCACFFAGDNCPLCGKECPEEFRAGNRKTVKQKKRKGNSSPRTVTFIDWYHSWWVIILALFVFPIAGFILLLTSPHKKSLKIGVGIAALIWFVLPYLGGIGMIFGNIAGFFGEPAVDTSLTREEYIAKCETITAEEFYRGADEYTDDFVSVTVTVSKKIVYTETLYNNNSYYTYYTCRGLDGTEFEIIIHDCIQDSSRNYLPGDVLTVYGEGAGEITIYDENYIYHTAPTINVAYVEAKYNQG